MTDIIIEISLIDNGFRANIARLLQSGSDLTPLMTQIAGIIQGSTDDAFEREADPNFGVPWAALTPRYIKQREKTGHWPGKKLQITGQLAESIKPRSGADFAEVFVGEPYGIFHQFGTRKMVARPFLGISVEAEQTILDRTGRFVREQLGVD